MEQRMEQQQRVVDAKSNGREEKQALARPVLSSAPPQPPTCWGRVLIGCCGYDRKLGAWRADNSRRRCATQDKLQRWASNQISAHIPPPRPCTHRSFKARVEPVSSLPHPTPPSILWHPTAYSPTTTTVISPQQQ
nr:hypothetical protein CFP56_23933 [Quercus suber]